MLTTHSYVQGVKDPQRSRPIDDMSSKRTKSRSKGANAPVGDAINWYERIPQQFKSDQKLDDYKNFDLINLPSISRFAIVGSSGAMKTNTLMTMLLNMNCWAKIFLFCKNPKEPLYAFLKYVMDAVSKKFKMDLLTVETDITKVPTAEELAPYAKQGHRILIIIDDMAAEKKSKLANVEELYTWVRKLGARVSLCYISQQFSKIPFFIRNNTDVIIMKRINQNRDLNYILEQYNPGKTLVQPPAVRQLNRFYV